LETQTIVATFEQAILVLAFLYILLVSEPSVSRNSLAFNTNLTTKDLTTTLTNKRCRYVCTANIHPRTNKLTHNPTIGTSGGVDRTPLWVFVLGTAT